MHAQANAGDCRVVLNRDGKAVQLSNDHTAASPAEQARIQNAGGRILADSTGKLRLNGRLQVTRSLGDRDYIRDGLLCEPEITRFELTSKDEFLVMATDGVCSARRTTFFFLSYYEYLYYESHAKVWDFISNAKVVQHINEVCVSLRVLSLFCSYVRFVFFVLVLTVFSFCPDDKARGLRSQASG
jgi:hypothetical protein